MKLPILVLIKPSENRDYTLTVSQIDPELGLVPVSRDEWLAAIRMISDPKQRRYLYTFANDTIVTGVRTYTVKT